MQRRISRKYCHVCKKNVKAEKNQPSMAFGLLTGGLSHAYTDKAWHCSECGSKLNGLVGFVSAIKEAERKRNASGNTGNSNT